MEEAEEEGKREEEEERKKGGSERTKKIGLAEGHLPLIQVRTLGVAKVADVRYEPCPYPCQLTVTGTYRRKRTLAGNHVEEYRVARYPRPRSTTKKKKKKRYFSRV